MPAVLGFAIWTHLQSGSGVLPGPVEVSAFLLVVAAAWAIRDGHPGWGFAATTAAIAATVVAMFVHLYPNVMVSSTNSAYNLTVKPTARPSHYALTVMTVVAVVFTPLVLAYQGWSYHVFRGPHQRARRPGDARSPAVNRR